MGKAKNSDRQVNENRVKIPETPEAEEAQLTALAYNLARKQLIEGTASSQVIVHFLKLSNERARLERAKLEHETRLLEAKTTAIKESAEDGRRYEAAIAAMKRYSGHGSEEDSDLF